LKRLNWNLNLWIEEKIIEIRRCLEKYVKYEGVSKEDVIKELLEGIEGTDKLSWIKLWDYLLQCNIVMEVMQDLKKLVNFLKNLGLVITMHSNYRYTTGYLKQ